MFVQWKPDLSHMAEIRTYVDQMPMRHLAETQREEHRRYLRQRHPELATWATPGSLVYSAHHQANVPVLGASWDAGALTWRLSTIGYGAPLDNFYPARANKPTLRMEATGPRVWKVVGIDPAALASTPPAVVAPWVESMLHR